MIAAIDCDLHKSFALRNDGTTLFSGSPLIDPELFAGCDVVLFEVASPVDYSDSKAIAHHKRRWTIWNIAEAARIDPMFRRGRIKMLVAPSHVWTKGFTLTQRHMMAKCSAKNKDLRECEAMLWFFDRDSRPWMTLSDYLDNL